jgi:hypothetical protein
MELAGGLKCQLVVLRHCKLQFPVSLPGHQAAVALPAMIDGIVAGFRADVVFTRQRNLF